jgi:hypothetical protein
MAKRRKPSNATIRAAEITGRALGQVAGSFDSLKARHPHPITEAREALAVRFEKFTALASEGGARSAAVVHKAKAVAKRTRKVAKGAKKVVRRARKTVARRASRLKR